MGKSSKLRITVYWGNWRLFEREERPPWFFYLYRAIDVGSIFLSLSREGKWIVSKSDVLRISLAFLTGWRIIFASDRFPSKEGIDCQKWIWYRTSPQRNGLNDVCSSTTSSGFICWTAVVTRFIASIITIGVVFSQSTYAKKKRRAGNRISWNTVGFEPFRYWNRDECLLYWLLGFN